jgi:hydrogenase-4 component B
VTGTVFIAGLSLITLGGIVSGARRNITAGLIVAAAGAVAVAVAGFWIFALGRACGAAFTSAVHPSLGVDRLSGLFLGMMGIVAAPVLLFSVSYLRAHPRRRAIAVLTSAFLLVLALVLVARDPLTFLAGWELMTLLPAAVILVARAGDNQARRTVFTYLAITHLGGVGTWIAVLLAARYGMIGGNTAVSGVASGTGLQICIALAALVGMGTKAGVMPLHVWLPRAHPIAPAPVSALMSGVMTKIAIYALVRVLVEWVGVLPLWFGVVVTAVGALSAVGGVVYAIFQHELKRLLALSSIENIGIIVLGVGACLMLRARGADVWASFALAAALLHTLNHAVFKALLFLGAGAFEQTVGTLHLDRLGGLLRRMPWTGAAFLTGSMAIAGLPPLNGFASEWTTMQALLHVTVEGKVGDGLAGTVALAALAATAALALLCFVKVVGLVLLGPARYDVELIKRPPADMPPANRPPASRPPVSRPPVREAAPPMVAAMVFLALGCIVLGLAPGVVFRFLVDTAPWPHPATAVVSGVGLRLPNTGGLPTVGLVAVLAILIALLALLRRSSVAAPAPSWACGQLVEPQLNWTSAGFTKPLRLVLGPVLRPRREITVHERDGVVRQVTYHGHVPQLIDDWVYRPILRWSIAGAARARRLQSGSLSRYVVYLIGLVVLLLGAARIGLFG